MNMKPMQAIYTRAYFRKVRHACGMNKKGQTLVNLGQFEDETPLNITLIQNFLSLKMPNKINKGRGLRMPNAISV